jgi:hypothetical protein
MKNLTFLDKDDDFNQFTIVPICIAFLPVWYTL